MQTFIQDILHTYTYTYVHTVVNNSSVTHKVRCYPTLVTARKEYMRTHPILTALIRIYTKYLHSIVSPAVGYISCDCKIVFLIIYSAMPRGRFGRLADIRNSFISYMKPKVETSRVKYSSDFELWLFTSF